VIWRTQKLQFKQCLLSYNRLRLAVGFQSFFEDALHAMHVDQIEVQSAAAGRVQTAGAVTIPQADQLLSLPQAAPGKLSFQESVGEVSG
jgi:hypothetical protein